MYSDPSGIVLSLRDQITFGDGLPDTLQFRLTSSPFNTFKIVGVEVSFIGEAEI